MWAAPAWARCGWAACFSAPVLTGNIDVSDGRLTFIYLGTTYTFCRPDSVFRGPHCSFRTSRCATCRATSGTINGNIYERGFQDMRLDLNGFLPQAPGAKYQPPRQ